MRKTVRVFAASAFLAACSGTQVESDSGGSGRFCVRNAGSIPIRVETTTASIPEAIDTSAVIAPDTSLCVYSDARIGGEVALGDVKGLRVLDARSGLPVYAQAPLDPARWRKDSAAAGAFRDFTYTFEFPDSLIGPFRAPVSAR